MKVIKKKQTLGAIAQLVAGTDMAPAWVGIENLSTGTPVINVVFPENNLSGVDYSEAKRALHEHYVIVVFSPPDGRESITFWLSEADVEFHSAGPNERPAPPILKENLGRVKTSRNTA